MAEHTINLQKDIPLENGYVLHHPSITYHTYGTLNEDKSNVIWVCHALTGNSDVFDWWAGLFGEEDLFNPKEHFIVCANILGSHYGTEGPLSFNKDKGSPYFHDFPQITIRDITALHIELADYLNIENIELLIGGSMGGHQALEWAIIESERIRNLCVLASSAVISPWAAAYNHSQRMAIENDASWTTSHPEAGIEGMKTARSIALLSYRNYTAYSTTQKEEDTDIIYHGKALSYQEYQGEKLAARFNAYSYWHLSKAMDSQNVGRNRGGIAAALSLIKARTLVLSIEQDGLFPAQEQHEIAQHIPSATHHLISSKYGHDGFLIETRQIAGFLEGFLVGELV